MPNINLSWIPGSTTINGQRISAIAKPNEGTSSFMTTIFTPTNPLASSVIAAAFTTNNKNIVYRFKVENLCNDGTTLVNTNGIQEGIIFGCIPPSVKAGDTTTTTYTARILKGMYTQVDGVNYPNAVSSISAIEYTLYNAANTQAIANQGPFKVTTITGVGSSESFEHTFTGLTPGTTYTLRYVLFATVNTFEVRSDAAQYLGVACLNNGVNTTSGAPTCSNYKIQNFQTGVGQQTSYTYTDCANNPQTGIVQPNTFDTFCALSGSVVDGGAVLTIIGDCSSSGFPCRSYTVDNATDPQGGQVGTYSYTDCNTNVSNSGSLNPNESVTFCAYENSVVLSGANLSVSNVGPCSIPLA